MDSKFSIAGFSFGLDGIIGLIPGVGDVVGGVISLFIIYRLKKIGIREKVLNKMIINVLVDVFVGSIPLVGDLFDFVFKVNERNLKLAKRDV